MRSRRNRAIGQFKLRLVSHERIHSRIIMPLHKDPVRTGFLVHHVVAFHRFVFLADGLLVIVTGRELQVNIVLELKVPLPKLEALVKLQRIRNRDVITNVNGKIVIKRCVHPRGFQEVACRIPTFIIVITREARIRNHFLLRAAIRRFNLHAHAIFDTQVVLRQEGHSNKRVEVQDLRPRIFGTLERTFRHGAAIVKAAIQAHATEAVEQRYLLGDIRDRKPNAKSREERRRIDIQRVFTRLREVLFPLEVRRNRNIPERQGKARRNLQRTRHRIAE